MLGQQNNSRGADYAAALRREAAQSAPPAAPVDYEQMWASKGVTPAQAVQAGEGGGQYTWGFNPLLGDATPGSLTNAEFVNPLLPSIPQSSASVISNFVNDPDWRDKRNMGNFSNPEDARARLGSSELAPHVMKAFQDLYGAAYQRQDLATPVGGGPTAVTGYAPPVQGGS